MGAASLTIYSAFFSTYLEETFMKMKLVWEPTVKTGLRTEISWRAHLCTVKDRLYMVYRKGKDTLEESIT